MNTVIASIALIALAASLVVIAYTFINDLIARGVASTRTEKIGVLPPTIQGASLYDYRDVLILYYTFDDVEGTHVPDHSGNDNHGTYREAECRYKLKQYNGHYYEFYSRGCFDTLRDEFGDRVDWPHFYKYCKKRGGYLAVPQNDAENNFLRNEAFGDSWIGIFQDPDDLNDNYGYPEGCPENEPGGCWKSVPEEDLNLESYSNWRDKEPNNSWGVQHCARIVTSDGTWDDEYCVKAYNFVCEYSSDRPEDLNINGVKEPIKISRGVFESALLFDGIDSYVKAPEINMGTGPLTIVFYYKETQQRDRDRDIWRGRPCPGVDGYLVIDGLNPGGVALSVETNREIVHIAHRTAEPQLNRWALVGIEREGNEWHLYWNGHKVATAIDRRSDKTVCFTHYIGESTWRMCGGVEVVFDEVRIYNKALGPDIIRDFYYRLHLVVYNPNDTEVDLDNASVKIGDECVIDLEYNTNYITESGTSTLPPKSSAVVKVSTIQCELTKGVKDVCIIYGGVVSCGHAKLKIQ